MTLNALRAYWVTHRNPKLLFPRRRTAEEQYNAREPMDRGGTQKPFKAIVSDVGIRKDITIHTLRHCYGTLLTDAGVSLPGAYGPRVYRSSYTVLPQHR